jgi:beta-glucosidase/6-phospho-beta-glucosidase/beta-galactosidase
LAPSHRTAAYAPSAIFESFFLGGFECSTHRRPDGKRLDLTVGSGHDHSALEDYRLLTAAGLKSFRDGVRWHLVEKVPGHYDWSSLLALIRAAEEAHVQIIWDLMHYGWPDDLDIFSADFVERFGRFAGAAAGVIQQECRHTPFYCPVNEISYFAWAGGDKALMNPFCLDQGNALKRQLVRASIAAIEAVRSVDAAARIVHAEPLVHVAPDDPDFREGVDRAATVHEWQYQAMDMLTGRMAPELGGKPDYVDVLGVNYYPDNQWLLSGNTIPMGHHRYRPMRELLQECYARYRRPLFLSETGAEGTARPAWLYYVVQETLAARRSGVEVEGLCLYPVLDYPGWLNDRVCHTGLLGPLDQNAERLFYKPLLDQLISSAADVRNQATEVNL